MIHVVIAFFGLFYMLYAASKAPDDLFRLKANDTILEFMFDEKGFILENIIRAFKMGKMIMEEVDLFNSYDSCRFIKF